MEEVARLGSSGGGGDWNVWMTWMGKGCYATCPGLQDPGVGDSDILLASGHFSPLYVGSEHKPSSEEP